MNSAKPAVTLTVHELLAFFDSADAALLAFAKKGNAACVRAAIAAGANVKRPRHRR